MKVTIDGGKSDTAKQNVGVPQGSVLSPILFLVMMHDFPSRKLNTNIIFADDVATLCRAQNNHTALQILQPHLNAIGKWATKWRLKFAVPKCALVVFSRQRHPPKNPKLVLNSQIINMTNGFKYLGVIFDSKLR